VKTRRLMMTTLACLGIVAGLASCVGVTVSPGHGAAFLTGWDNDHYDVGAGPDYAVVSTPAEANSNNQRLVFWNWTSQPSTNQEVCANWVASTSLSNQWGLALRVVSGDGRTQAITITNNVFGTNYNTFNMHVWDTNWGGDLPAIAFGSFKLPAIGGDRGPLPLPLRMCAKAVDNVLSFVVWPLPGTQPAYGDPTWGAAAHIPDGAPGYGMPGLYAGHVQPGGSVSYNGIASRSL